MVYLVWPCDMNIFFNKTFINIKPVCKDLFWMQTL